VYVVTTTIPGQPARRYEADMLVSARTGVRRALRFLGASEPNDTFLPLRRLADKMIPGEVITLPDGTVIELSEEER
jgi:hypothetical protein